jgi:hypothetical protein
MIRYGNAHLLPHIFADRRLINNKMPHLFLNAGFSLLDMVKFPLVQLFVFNQAF